MKKNNKWTTSLNGDLFNGDEYNTKAEAMVDINNDLPEGTTYWVGQIRNIELSELIDADIIFENMACQADDLAGEVAEDYMSFRDKSHIAELNELLIKWFKKKGYEPTFYGITNSEKLVSTKK